MSGWKGALLAMLCTLPFSDGVPIRGNAGVFDEILHAFGERAGADTAGVDPFMRCQLVCRLLRVLRYNA